MSLIAVYGTLRRGEPNYENIVKNFGASSIRYLETLVLQGLKLYSLGIIPACVPDIDGILVTDIFEVNPQAQRWIDFLEGGYIKGKLTLKNGSQPFIYYMPKASPAWIPIPSGDWVGYQHQAYERGGA